MSPPFTDPAIATTFRLAEVEDIPQLTSLLLSFAKEADPSWVQGGLAVDKLRQWLAWNIKTGASPHIIALDGGDIIGSIAYSLSEGITERPVAEIGRFYVMPLYRRGSIGRILLTLAIESARGDGAAGMRAFVNSGIAGGANVFKRFGFDVVPHSVLLTKEI